MYVLKYTLIDKEGLDKAVQSDWTFAVHIHPKDPFSHDNAHFFAHDTAHFFAHDTAHFFSHDTAHFFAHDTAHFYEPVIQSNSQFTTVKMTTQHINRTTYPNILESNCKHWEKSFEDKTDTRHQ